MPDTRKKQSNVPKRASRGSSPGYNTRKRRSRLTTLGEEIRGPLGIRSRPDHICRRSVPDLPQPPDDVSHLVLRNRYVSASQSAEERSAHLRRQLLPAVPLAPEPDRLGDPRSAQPGGVSGPVGQFVEEGSVVGLRRGKTLQCRHSDSINAWKVSWLSWIYPGLIPGDEVLAGDDRLDLARLLDLDALALREVEDFVVPDQRPVALKRHRHRLAVLVGDLLRVETGPEDHHAARLLPTPDVAARPPDLVVGAPPGVAGEEEAVSPTLEASGAAALPR